MSILIFCIGLLAQACFSARILIQWFLSERNMRSFADTVLGVQFDRLLFDVLLWLVAQ